MSSFRRLDYVDLSDFLYVIGVTGIFLSAIYFLLKFAKPYLLSHVVVSKKESSIQVEEVKHVPNVGHVCVLSVKQSYFVAVSSKVGVSIAPLVVNTDSVASSEEKTGQELI